MRILLVATIMVVGLAPSMSRAADVEAVLAALKKNNPDPIPGLEDWAGTSLALKPFTEGDIMEVARRFESDEGWDAPLERIMEIVFRNLGERAAVAIDPLLKIACEETAPTLRRVRALHALESMGELAVRAVPDLQRLRKDRDSRIQEEADRAILATKSPEAAPMLAEKLETAPDSTGRFSVLLDLASLGASGKTAGASVVKYLDDEDWMTRLVAIKAIRNIGFTAASGDLIRQLDDERDWRPVLDSAEALGHLKAASAEAALKRLSEEHWFSPVRATAQAALASIHADPAAKLSSDEEVFLSALDYSYVGVRLDTIPLKEVDLIRFPVAVNPDQPFPIWTEVYPSNKVQWFGLKINGGYLAGYYGGEWGGKLAFVDAEGNRRILAEANTELIYQTAGKFFAVTGYSHLGSNEGVIYQLTEMSSGQWTAKRWRVLPGAPAFSRLLADGRLFVSCREGGIVLVSPDGKMQQLTRAEALK